MVYWTKKTVATLLSASHCLQFFTLHFRLATDTRLSIISCFAHKSNWTLTFRP
jgi:hypothetical protein